VVPKPNLSVYPDKLNKKGISDTGHSINKGPEIHKWDQGSTSLV
jgi:hypothetical protein